MYFCKITRTKNIMGILTTLIICIFGMLQIILFFKLWGMTNDVRKLTEQFCNHDTSESQARKEQCTFDYDKRLDTLKNGDHVIRVSDGKKMLVSKIEGENIICSVSLLSGVEAYRKDQLKFIQ